jgi:hypothetical protein
MQRTCLPSDLAPELRLPGAKPFCWRKRSLQANGGDFKPCSKPLLNSFEPKPADACFSCAASRFENSSINGDKQAFKASSPAPSFHFLSISPRRRYLAAVVGVDFI